MKHQSSERDYNYPRDYGKEWNDSGVRDYATNTNLVSEDYGFTPKPAESTWLESSITSMDIFASNSFWEDWGLIAFLVFLFLLLVYGIYKYRLSQILYIQEAKNTISADLHDEIGSKLTNIQLLSAISKNKLNGSDPMSTLGKIEKEAQASAEALDEIVWNINKTDESLLEIFARMRRYASEFFEADNILYDIHVAQGFEEQKMCMQKRRELLLIFKELLTNVRKHSKANNVIIKIMPVNEGLALKVKDDGVGFDANQEHSRNGIRNISFRMDKWKGKMDLNSQLGQGTTIEVWLPFNCSWIDRILNFKGIFSIWK